MAESSRITASTGATSHDWPELVRCWFDWQSPHRACEPDVRNLSALEVARRVVLTRRLAAPVDVGAREKRRLLQSAGGYNGPHSRGSTATRGPPGPVPSWSMGIGWMSILGRRDKLKWWLDDLSPTGGCLTGSYCAIPTAISGRAGPGPPTRASISPVARQEYASSGDEQYAAGNTVPPRPAMARSRPSCCESDRPIRAKTVSGDATMPGDKRICTPTMTS